MPTPSPRPTPVPAPAASIGQSGSLCGLELVRQIGVVSSRPPADTLKSASQTQAVGQRARSDTSMIEELVYPSNKMPPHLKCQVLSFLRIMWPNGFVLENRLRDWISHEEDHSISMMLVEKGVLISHTQVVWKYLDHAGETYKAYGLSGVFTYPAFRGKGHGKRIVDKGTSYIEASDADIGIFHCDMSLKQFYASSGWIPIETAVTLEGPKDNPVIDDEMMMMRFFTEHGKKGRPAFEKIPLYFGEYTW